MITKNINGGNLSANYATAVAGDNRNWQVRLYADNVLLDCAIASLAITKGSCGSSEGFSIGNVVSSMLEAELLELSANIKGSDIKVEVGLDTGSVEWICVGHFTAVEVTKTTYSTTVTGYGFSTSKTGGSFTIPATKSLANIASAIATATGCTVTFDSGIDTSKVINGTLTEGMSCYEGLQTLAHLIGGYAVDTNDGNIAIHKFSSTGTVSVDTSRMVNLPNLEESAFSVTGVYVLVTEADPEADPPVPEVSYTYGTPVVLYDKNENMSADIFNIYKGIVGYSYYTGDIDLTLGDPRIEGNDVLSVTDVDGNVYAVPCHSITHSYDGGLSTTVTAVKATSNADGIYSVAPVTQRIDQISTATAIAQASAQRAEQYADDAYTYAQEAKETTDEINAYAETAGKTVTQILEDGETAGQSAQQALMSAQSASEYASRALGNLSTVQSVAETLTWIAQHGTMTKTGDYIASSDTEVVTGKKYYTRTGSGTSADPYVYTLVANPTGNPSTSGYYEGQLSPSHVYFVVDANGDYIVGSTHYSVVPEPDVADISTYYELSIDESLNNYVGTHLAVTSEGLWLIPETNGTPTTNGKKILIATGSGSTYTTAGTYIIDRSNGTDKVVARFTADDVVIGEKTATHLVLDRAKLAVAEGESVYLHGNVFETGLLNDPTTGLAYLYEKPSVSPSSTGEVYFNVSCSVDVYTGGHGTAIYSVSGNPDNVVFCAISGTQDDDGVYFDGSGIVQGKNFATLHPTYSIIQVNYYTQEEVPFLKMGKTSNANSFYAVAIGETAGAYDANTFVVGNDSKAYTTSAVIGKNLLNYNNDNSLVIGKYNDIDKTGLAFEIGNGKASARSDALTVSWEGDIETALDTTAQSGVDYDIYSALQTLGWDSDVIV